MHKEEVDSIREFLTSKIGENRGLLDWCSEINSQKLIKRKLTPRELAFIFNRVIKNNPFVIERTSEEPIYYRFMQQEIL